MYGEFLNLKLINILDLLFVKYIMGYGDVDCPIDGDMRMEKLGVVFIQVKFLTSKMKNVTAVCQFRSIGTLLA